MKTLAIDASTKSSGVAVFNDGRLIHYQCITATQYNSLDRIIVMTQKLIDICKKYSPTDIVMQQVLPEDVKHNQNVYKALIYLQASVALAFHKLSYSITFFPVAHWRKICGIKMGPGIKRDQLKAASQNLVKQIYKIQVNDDISDAICLGMAYIMQQKKKSAF